MKNLMIICAGIVILAGCSGHCIKLGGEFSGVAGNIEYCVDKTESINAGKPVLKDEKTGLKSIIISEQDAEKILEKIEPKAEVKMQGILEKNPVSATSRLGIFLRQK